MSRLTADSHALQLAETLSQSCTGPVHLACWLLLLLLPPLLQLLLLVSLLQVPLMLRPGLPECRPEQ
jgi:hypothetical protein